MAFERYSTWALLSHVYRRHETGIIYTALALTYLVYLPLHALGVI